MQRVRRHNRVSGLRTPYHPTRHSMRRSTPSCEIFLSIPETLTEYDEDAIDFYTTFDPYNTNILDREEYSNYIKNLDDREKKILDSDKNYYEMQFSNIGGLVMPIILEFIYVDGTKEIIRIPAEIWKKNSNSVKKVFILEKEISNVILDPFIETADTDRNNNYWPTKSEPTRFQLLKQKDRNSENPMQQSRKIEERLQNDK